MLNIEVVEQFNQPVLMVRKNTSIKDLPNITDEAHEKVLEYLKEFREVPIDAPFVAYHKIDKDNLEVDLGFPVSKGFPGKEDIERGNIPAGNYATAMFKGPYSKLGHTYNEILKWIDDNGYKPVGTYYEFYYNSPDEVAEDELLTKVSIPIE